MRSTAAVLILVSCLLLSWPTAHAHDVTDESSILIGRSSCDPTNATLCAARCTNLHGSDTYLSDKCCTHAGLSASLLAFEEDPLWVPRLEEFNECTGAKVRLEYLPEGEDGMADALRMDVGDDSGNFAGEGIFDAYLVQAPW